MKKRTHITLPRVHSPGKGHPPETLAYLSEAEHDFIRRMTDGRHSKGPGGVRSYVLGGATTKGTAANSTMKSAASSSSVRGGGGTGGVGGTASKSSTSGGGKMGASSSQSGGVKSGSGATGSKGGGASTQKAGSGGNQGTVNTKSLNAAKSTLANNRNTALGKVSQAAQQNVSRSSSGTATGWMGGNTSRPGISMTATQNANRVNAVSRGPGVISGALPGATNAQAQIRTLAALQNSIAENPRFGVRYSPGALNMIPRAVIGEAQFEGDVGRAATANVMMNRLALGLNDPASYGYLGAGSIPRMMRGIDAAGVDPNRPGLRANAGYRNTRPGTESYADGLRSVADSLSPYSQFSTTATPRTLNATHYYNPSIANPAWGERRSGTPFDTVGNHVFGNAERTAGQVANLRGGETPTQFASAAIGSIPRPRPRPDMAPVPRPTPRPDSFPRGFGDTGVNRTVNPYSAPERVLGVENYITPGTTVNSNAYDTNRAPGPGYSGVSNFTPPAINAGLSRNAFDTARAAQYSGVSNFNTPDRTAGLSRNAFDGRTPAAYAGYGGGLTPFAGLPTKATEQPKLVAKQITDRVPPSMGPQGFTKSIYDRIAPTFPAQYAADPRLNMAMGIYPASAQVMPPQIPTDPRVNMTPGALPAAPRMSPFGNVGQEYHEHGTTPNPSQYRNEMPPAAPHPGTPGSQTAEGPSLWQNPGAWFQEKTGVDPNAVQQAATEKTQEYFDAVEKHGVDAVQQYANQQSGMGLPRSLTDPGGGRQDNPRPSYALLGGGGGGGGGGTPSGQQQMAAADLLSLRARMVEAGATAEEIAYIDSLLAETRSA